MSILKIILFGLPVIVLSVLLWMLTGLIVSPSGSETPLNYIALLPCIIIPMLFARINKSASVKIALAQGTFWAIMISCIIFPLSIHNQGLQWVLIHPEIYLMPVSVFIGPMILYLYRILRKQFSYP